MITELFPRDYKERRFHEPFFGGGAVFFHLEPAEGSINDINPHLMNFYRVIRDKPRELIEEAVKYRYEEEEYYRLRDRFNHGSLSDVEEAALLLYLNKTAYNGLYRVNSKGEFNVPFGRYKHPNIVKERQILRASELLRNVEIHCEDFNYLLKVVHTGDLCYIDPPYHPTSETANFTDYAAGGFKASEHHRLRDLCLELDEMGVIFVLSNSNTETIMRLYTGIGNFQIFPLKTKRMISSRVSSRDSGNELLITNYTRK
jgi:DNA adenine methylase